MKNCPPTVAHVVKGDKFGACECPKNKLEQKEMGLKPYDSVVESLMYTQVCTLPDIAYITGTLGGYQSNPGKEHWKSAKKEVLWRSHKQELTTTSTIMVEYVACYHAASHAILLRNIVSGLKLSVMVRKRRTELPGAGESSEPQGAAGAQRPPAQQQQQPQPQQQRPPGQQQPQQRPQAQYQQPPQPQQQGGYQGRGRGGPGPQGGYQGGPPQGGRGYAPRGPPPQGRGGVVHQQYPGGQPQQQGRGAGPQQQQQAPRGIAPSQRAAGSGPVYAPTPELHQATQAPQQPGVTMQPVRAESSAGSSSNQPVHEAMAQLKPPSAAQQEETMVQAAPAS
ncbi:hypothetical protein Tco_0472821, partial [Tanacetum coccineum]